MTEKNSTVKRTPRKFLRRDWNRFARLGKKVKKNQKWKRPTGRDNKMREKRGSYPSTVSVGYRTDKVEREKINGQKLVFVQSISDLSKVGKNEIVSIGRLGKKKKIEIAKKAKEANMKIYNLNVERFLKRNELKGKKPEIKPKTGEKK